MSNLFVIIIVFVALALLSFLSAILVDFLDFLMMYKQRLWKVRYRLAKRAAKDYFKATGHDMPKYFHKRFNELNTPDQIDQSLTEEVRKIEFARDEVNRFYSAIGARVYWFKFWICRFCFGAYVALILGLLSWVGLSLSLPIGLWYAIGFAIPYMLAFAVLNHFFLQRV